MTPTKYHPPSVATSHGGFTLIEAMIVVVIVAVLAAMAAPSFTGFIEKNRVKEATEAVLGILHQAKAETSSRDQDMYFDIEKGSSWCLGYVVDPNGSTTCNCKASTVDCLTKTGDTDVTTVLNNDSQMTGVTLDTGSISGSTFTPSSSLTEINFKHLRKTHDTGTIQIKSDSGDWEAYIRLNGFRIRSCVLNNGKGVAGYPIC